jgi:DNA-binding HxlR family transcriptional regulator
VTDRKSYGQFCALARALDRVGDRWTLLVVRELLLRPARYGELAAALPGMATNLLASRLRQLAADGLVERTPDAAYRLTPRGEDLELVVLALIRWGAAYMPQGPGDDAVDERWFLLGMRAMLEAPPGDLPHAKVAVRSGALAFTVVVDDDGRRVLATAADAPSAVVTAPLRALLKAVSAGAWSEEMTVKGDAAVARALLTASPA